MHPNLLKKPEQADLFINRAIELGFDEICFTDHMPFSVTGDECDRIPFGMVGEYCEKVREKADQYKDWIIIKTGIEIDYHPSYIKEIEKVLLSGKFDYILGSSHLNISGFNIVTQNITRTDFARLVLENYLSAAKSGYFDAISHIDVYRWVFSVYQFLDNNYSYKSHIDILYQLFEVLQKNEVMLEINASPLYKKFDNLGAYPEDEILDLSRRYDIKYIYGSDAHSYDKVGWKYDRFIGFLKEIL